jgi:hypothetical protein
VPGFATVNLRTGYQMGKEAHNLRLAVGVKNLFDRRYYLRSTDNNGGKYVGMPHAVRAGHAAVLNQAAASMTALRSLWLRLHRWLALGLGWVLVLAGLTGALLVVAQPLDRRLHAELFTAPAPSGAATPTALAPLYARLRQDLATRPPSLPSAPAAWRQPVGHGARQLERHALPQPWTGQEQGRRGETEGFVNTLFKLHSSLLLESTGKAILAWVALAYLVLLVTGLVLWWPRHWAQAWRVELRKNLARSLFDLHRVGGAALGVLLAVSVATGAYMAWRPLGGVINAFTGASTVEPPNCPSSRRPPALYPPWMPCGQRHSAPCQKASCACCSCLRRPPNRCACAFWCRVNPIPMA